MSFQVDEFAAAVRRHLAEGESPDGPVSQFLAAADGRAVGLWRNTGESLEQLSFQAVSEMPAAVRSEFAAITKRVPLADGGLGIVQAVVSGQPAVGTRDGASSGLEGSATWLERFEAVQSLAVPVCHGQRVLGVLALSAAHRLDEGGPDVELLEQAAASLEEPLLATMDDFVD